MNSELIQTFLAVYETRNITKAAKQLSISQSAVSERIRQLETETNQTFFLRERGYKQIETTNACQTFLPLAYQWLSLDQEMRRLDIRQTRESLVIGAPESFHSATFIPFYPLARVPRLTSGSDVDEWLNPLW